MEEHNDILKNRYDELPIGLQKFISSKIWSEPVSKISRQFSLNKDQEGTLENEILFVLLCMEPATDLVENLKNELKIDDNLARKISDYMNGAVFSQVMKDIKDVWASISSTEVNSETKPEIKDPIGDSFEQAIMNQAKAMQPAKAAPAPNNLPTGATNPDGSIGSPVFPKIDISDDPYREKPE